MVTALAAESRTEKGALMLRYAIKRLLLLIPVILCTSAVVFFLMSMAPGDPAVSLLGTDAKPEALEAIREELGLNDSLIVQYGNYMAKLIRGDLGTSFSTRNNVFDEYMARFPATLKLTLGGMLVVILIAVPIGILSSLKPYSLLDNCGMIAALAGISMPSYWLGLLLIVLFAQQLGWLPSGGITAQGAIILPSITLGANMAANLTRTTRSSMIEIGRQDYIRTALAKGIGKRKTITVHALKNALIPMFTVACVELSSMIAGACVVETVFSWPGVGRLTIDAINRKDKPLAIGCLIMTAILISLISTMLDFIYAIVDPRIRADIKGGKGRA
ncbi:MAG TPA: ABC transporter permease [Negativicutes bacterium]|nr:ABC transporter permease [Negativicutes bacterium]